VFRRIGSDRAKPWRRSGVAPAADKVEHLPRVVDPISRITIHRQFPASLPRDREFGLSTCMNDNAGRALLSVGTGYFFTSAYRYMAESEHLLEGLEVQWHVGAEPLGLHDG